MEIDLPEWAFDAARFLCERRAGKFGNRFPSAKLRALHKDEPYFKLSEGVTGYLGDIAASIAVDRDPVEVLEEMIVATDGLSHRDEFDLIYRGWSIDAKIEDYGDHHEAVLAGEVTFKKPYGCRLINAAQYEQNKGTTDIYLFGCFNPPLGDDRLLHQIQRVLWLGWVEASVVEAAPEQGYSPAGARLPSKARVIDHALLQPIDQLLNIDPKEPPRTAINKQPDEAKVERIENLRAELRVICGRA